MILVAAAECAVTKIITGQLNCGHGWRTGCASAA